MKSIIELNETNFRPEVLKAAGPMLVDFYASWCGPCKMLAPFGFMAGAGIVVRNSIILVDFIELRLAEGRPLKEAVVEAGMIRFRPIMLTALAVVVGATVILFDPIFQGLAISLMAGSLVSMIIAPVAVPLLYFMAYGRKSRAEKH
ncbi:MAG: efflux RND transporter permease subunit [Verrucomicrobiota bacterium]|jgi:multidrug efflux pump subunit AcrB